MSTDCDEAVPTILLAGVATLAWRAAWSGGTGSPGVGTVARAAAGAGAGRMLFGNSTTGMLIGGAAGGLAGNMTLDRQAEQRAAAGGRGRQTRSSSSSTSSGSGRCRRSRPGSRSRSSACSTSGGGSRANEARQLKLMASAERPPARPVGWGRRSLRILSWTFKRGLGGVVIGLVRSGPADLGIARGLPLEPWHTSSRRTDAEELDGATGRNTWRPSSASSRRCAPR